MISSLWSVLVPYLGMGGNMFVHFFPSLSTVKHTTALASAQLSSSEVSLEVSTKIVRPFLKKGDGILG